MAFCSKCGKEIADNVSFCPYCGNPVGVQPAQQETDGVIVFKRESSAVAKIVKTKIIVDNNIYGELKEDEQISVRLPFGYHNIELKANGNPSLTFQANLNANCKEIYYPFKISMTGKPAFCGSEVPTASIQNTKPKKKKGGCLSAVAAIFAIIAIIFIFASLGSKSKESSKSSSVVSKTTTQEQTQASPTFKPVTGNVDTWEVTVNDFDYKESVSVGLLSEYKAEENSKYCIVNITVKNCGKESDIFLPLIAFEGDTIAKVMWNGYEYTRSELLWSNDNLSSESLNPLVSTSGDLAFELPDEVIDSGVPPVLVIKSGVSVLECELIKQ